LDLRGVSEGETPGRTALGQFVTIFEEFPALREVARENLLSEKENATHSLTLSSKSLGLPLALGSAPSAVPSHCSAKNSGFPRPNGPTFPINPRFAFAARICDDTMESQKSAQKAFLASVRGE
jgi:hypothetical protein